LSAVAAVLAMLDQVAAVAATWNEVFSLIQA
jgi:hypothetical protein